MIPRVVMDTGVLRSAVWGGRASGALIDLWLEEKLMLCVTEPIMAMYFQALTRIEPTPLIKAVLDRLRSGEAVRAFVMVPGEANPVPPEDLWIRCARQADAGALVTHDRSLIDLGPIGGVSILTPGAFLGQLVNP